MRRSGRGAAIGPHGAADVVCFCFDAAKSQHFFRFSPFYGRAGTDVGFLKDSCDFGQRFLPKVLSVFLSGGQKANIELIWARRGCLRRDLLTTGFVYSQREPYNFVRFAVFIFLRAMIKSGKK